MGSNVVQNVPYGPNGVHNGVQNGPYAPMGPTYIMAHMIRQTTESKQKPNLNNTFSGNMKYAFGLILEAFCDSLQWFLVSHHFFPLLPLL